MLFHSEPLFSIYWGDKKTAFPRHTFTGVLDEPDYPFFKLAGQLMGMHSVVTLKQVHGTQGKILKTRKDLQLLASDPADGDYLISTLPGVGIAVISGDCLPIIVYDPHLHIVGIAHAGWLGSVQKIAIVMLEALLSHFPVRMDSIRIFLGPSAKACCYTIKEDVINAVSAFSFADQVLYQRQNEVFFDLPLFNILQLLEYGISRPAIHTHYSACTICDVSFCSHRREGSDGLRQITIAALR